MTRETKIGLLVGLAFIIVIGILLSDYNRIESPTAPLFNDNGNLRKSVGTPTAADNKSQGEKNDTIVYPVKANSPRQQVPTREDLTPPQSNSDVVVISPFDGASPNPQRAGNSPQHTIASGGSSEVAINQPRGNVPQDLQNQAREHGTELVPAGPIEQRINNGNTAGPANNNTAAPAGSRQYTAEVGDTVSKMAGRFMGGNTKANRDAIVAANPSLQKNINNVVVGHAYVIPQTAGAPVAPPTVVAQKPQTQSPAAPVNQPAQSPTHWYTVKENDSLWKIAQEQLGDGNAVAAIKELNKDVLKGGDAIRPNMRLRMPAKPVASAS